MRKAEDYIIYLLLGGLLAFSISLNIINATVIPVSMGTMALFILAFLLIFLVIFYNQYTFFTFMMALTAAAAVIYWRKESILLGGGTLARGIVYLQNVFQFVRGYLPFTESYGVTVSVFVCGFIAFYMALAMYVTFQFYFVAALGFGAFSINWLMNYRRSDIAFAIFLFCFCALLFKKMNRKQMRNGLLALYMAPVCLLVVGVSYWLPAKQTKWDNEKIISFFRNPISKSNDFFYFIFNPKFFNFQSIGFTGQSGRLGGNLSLNNRYVMDVYADRPTYLAGLTRDTYENNAWTNRTGTFEPYDPEYAVTECVETFFSLPLQTSFASSAWFDADQSSRPASQITPISINIGSARTGTLFRPVNHYSLWLDTSMTSPPLQILTNETNDLRLNDVMPANAYYSYQYLDIDYGAGIIQNILRQSNKGLYQKAVDSNLYFNAQNISGITDSGAAQRFSVYRRGSSRIIQYSDPADAAEYQNLSALWAMWQWMSSAPYAYRSSNSWEQSSQFWNHKVLYKGASAGPYDTALDFFREMMIPYASLMYQRYTTVPDSVPQRVHDLALEITRDQPTDYDKAKAIEEYLARFPYTLTPGTVPRDRDFVDYFLFDCQEGYCTYYASAMAIMARCAGLPARYVEGYIMPSKASSPGHYVITNMQAHSWAEIYFEGFGWVPFEATAPYNYSFYEEQAPSDSSLFTPEFMSNPSYEDYIREMMGHGGGADSAAMTAAAAPKAHKGPSYLPLFIVMGIVAAAFAALLAVLAIGWLRVRTDMRKRLGLPPNEQAIAYFQAIIKMTRYYHYPIRADETPAMYARRIGKRFAFQNDLVFIRDLTPIYYQAKYARDPVSDKDLTLLSSCCYELLVLIRSMRRWPVFVWHRYITRNI